MDMKTKLHMLYLSAGKLETGDLYASVQVLNNDVENFDDGNRIGVGCKVAKIKILTDNNNEIANDLNKTFTLPADVICSIKTSVKGSEMVMTITGFDKPTLTDNFKKSDSSIKVSS